MIRGKERKGLQRMNKTELYNQLKDKAIKGWKEYQILPSIALVQAGHESAYGESRLAKKANALFGVKFDTNKEGKAYFKKTWEVIDGKRVDVIAPFKIYDSFEDSMDGYYQVFHGSDWRKEFYKGVIGETDYKKAAKALTGTYATDPEYGNKIIRIIEQDGLNKYDEMVLSKKEKEEEKEVDKSFSSLPKPYGEPDFYIGEIPVYKDFLSSSLPNYSGYAMNPKVIVVHETENFSDGANAEMHNRYLHNGAGGRSASWHFTVDDKCIFWHIPFNRNGWHAGKKIAPLNRNVYSKLL